jgi:archaellum component FlaC
MIGLLNAGPHVYTFTIEQLWTSILGVCGGITAIAAAVAVILNAIKKAKEPDTKQNAKLNDHDKHLEDVDRKLKNDKEVLDLYRSKILSLEEHQKEQDIIVEEHSRKIAGVEQRVNRSEHGINVMMKALLALLSHGIDGNAIDPMKEAKAALESYLIDGQSSKNT